MTPLETFKTNLERIKKLLTIGTYIELNTTSLIDSDEINRSALVLAVSALDHFVHEIVRTTLLIQFNNQESGALHKLTIPMEIALNINETNLDQHIRDVHGWKSFQTPDNINKILRPFLGDNIWVLVSQSIGESNVDIKNRLEAIVERRNKIAHEADIDPISGITRPLSKQDTDNLVSFIENVVTSINLSMASRPITSANT